MKINDVEQILGISKANIRFYEKQNLLSPNGRKMVIGSIPRRTLTDYKR